MGKRLQAVALALLAAVLYAVNLPFSKLLLGQVGSLTMAGLLYLGAGVGMALLSLFHRDDAPRLGREDLAPTLGMILLDIAAPVLLMLGLRGGEAASASLLGNFEIVATALFALILFREKVSRMLWAALGCITLSCGILSFQGAESLRFSAASLLVLGAACCWGLENNCTRRISGKSAREIVILKGFFSGGGSLCLARLAGESLPPPDIALRVMALGFVSYGLSIFLYVRAQRELGAARTSAYYSVNPFVGSLLALLLLRERLGPGYFAALPGMLLGVGLATADTLSQEHAHPHTHLVRGADGRLYPVTHTHPHRHFGGETHRHPHLGLGGGKS